MFKQKETLIILWLTFITVVAWISLSIFHIWVTSTISDIDTLAIEEINPAFDMNTINKLKAREIVVPIYQYKETIRENIATPAGETPIPQAPEEP
ncbi:hypothetical protein KJ980_00940 [Patescibacteria group bacterium]|nr:hypothetical protein [Patescibacteria group bacterium]